MDFTIPTELEQLRDSLKRFIEREIVPLEEKYKMEDVVPEEEHKKVRKRARELGFYGIHLPEDVGGGGLSNLGYVLLVEEIGRNRTDRFYSDIIGGAGGPTPMLLACNEEQKKKYLIPLVEGDITTCFCLTEPGAGSDASSIRTTAVKKNGKYVINGRKHFISNAPYADFAMVFAVTDKEKRAKGGITCFLVDMDTPGIDVKIMKSMLRDDVQGDVTFEDVEVPQENILGKLGYGFAQAMQWIAFGRLTIAAICVGLMERVLKMSVQYAKQRVQFGKPIAERQAIQWMLADMATDLYGTKNMLYNSAWRLDRGEDILIETSMLKVFATEAASKAVDNALQIHGGMGYMREHPLERIYRRVRVLRIVEGTSEIQRWIIARGLLRD